jgi:hypothetical protein
LAALEPQ